MNPVNQFLIVRGLPSILAAAKIDGSDPQIVTGDAPVRVQFNEMIAQTQAGLIVTGADWRFVAPVTGLYLCLLRYECTPDGATNVVLNGTATRLCAGKVAHELLQLTQGDTVAFEFAPDTWYHNTYGIQHQPIIAGQIQIVRLNW